MDKLLISAALLLRNYYNSGRLLHRAGVFARAAAHAEVGQNAGSIKLVGINGLLGALLPANEAKMVSVAFPPADTAAAVNFRQPDHGLFDGELRNSACRADFLTILS